MLSLFEEYTSFPNSPDDLTIDDLRYIISGINDSIMINGNITTIPKSFRLLDNSRSRLKPSGDRFCYNNSIQHAKNEDTILYIGLAFPKRQLNHAIEVINGTNVGYKYAQVVPYHHAFNMDNADNIVDCTWGNKESENYIMVGMQVDWRKYDYENGDADLMQYLENITK